MVEGGCKHPGRYKDNSLVVLRASLQAHKWRIPHKVQTQTRQSDAGQSADICVIGEGCPGCIDFERKGKQSKDLVTVSDM